MAILPPFSCDGDRECKNGNMGWRYLQLTLSLLTLCMVVARTLLFKMHESPKFLLSQGRYDEAVGIVHILANMNGKSIELTAEDLKNEAAAPKQSTGVEFVVAQIRVLFSRQLWITTVLVWTIWSTTSMGCKRS
jgi:hypothetical protein